MAEQSSDALHKPRPVTDFAHLYGDDPQAYPGERPDHSYVTEGRYVYDMRLVWQNGQSRFTIRTEQGEQNVNDFLQAAGSAPMEERIPIVAIGANGCPGALKYKFAVVEPAPDEAPADQTPRPDLLIVPVAYATMRGYDVVWSDRPGVRGNFMANLYADASTADTVIDIGLTFLTPEQALIMHSSEGKYDVARGGTVDLGGGHLLPAIMYAGKTSVYIDNQKPRAVAAVTARGRIFKAALSAGLLQEALAIKQVQAELRAELFRPDSAGLTADAYTRLALARDKDGRLALQAAVARGLEAAGCQGSVDLFDQLDDIEVMPRANPSQLPTFADMLRGRTTGLTSEVLTPEEVLGAGLGVKRQQVLDKIEQQAGPSEVL